MDGNLFGTTFHWRGKYPTVEVNSLLVLVNTIRHESLFGSFQHSSSFFRKEISHKEIHTSFKFLVDLCIQEVKRNGLISHFHPGTNPFTTDQFTYFSDAKLIKTVHLFKISPKFQYV